MFSELKDHCNNANNIHRDPRFLLQNPAPAATKILILKSGFDSLPVFFHCRALGLACITYRGRAAG
jgi:hypothetical protein